MGCSVINNGSQELLVFSDLRERFVIGKKNRFVLLLNNKEGVVLEAHINNTGRLEELLVEGRRCYTYPISGAKLKERVLAVEEADGRVAIIDTGVHMRAFEKISKDLLGFSVVGKNPRFEDSVFDFLLEDGFLVEVKSATLRNGSYAEYPDTRSERGERHVKTLTNALRKGRKTYLIFVSGLSGVSSFRINKDYEQFLKPLIREFLEAGGVIKAFSIVLDKNRGKVFFNKELRIDVL